VVRITADSNIYISALNFGGVPDKLLELARAGEIQLSISGEILGEVVRVLRDKFGWSEEALTIAKERIADFAELVTPMRNIDAVKDDPTDNRVLECAVTGASDYVVTGDNHLLRLGEFAGAKIVKASDFLAIQSPPGRGR
jgi:putative PIN family toxin of toxin-antitoxin system